MANNTAVLSDGCSMSSKAAAARPTSRKRMPLSLIRLGEVMSFIDDGGGISGVKMRSRTTNIRRFSSSRRIQLRQLRSGLFPFGGQALEVLDDGAEVAVDLQRGAGFLVGLRFFQIRGQLGLSQFEFRDFLFQPMHDLLLRFAFARARLALLGFQAFLILPVPGGADSITDLRAARSGSRTSGGARRQSRALGNRGGLVEVILV